MTINTAKSRISKLHVTRGFNPRTNMSTKYVAGIEIPETGINLPYCYRSLLYRDDFSGVQTKHLGVLIKELRREKNLSRNGFCNVANSLVEQYGIRLTQFNLSTYERGQCMPKADKMLACYLAISALTNDKSEGKAGGYCKVKFTGFRDRVGKKAA